MQKQSTISDLQHELKTLKDRLNTLDEERKLVENQSLTQNDRNLMMIKSLEAQLNKVNHEYLLTKQDYDKRIESIHSANLQTVEKVKLFVQIDKTMKFFNIFN